MKKKGQKPYLLISVLFFSFLFAAVLFVSASSKKKEHVYPVTRVSVILPHEDDGYWNLVQNGMLGIQQECEELYHMDIKYLIPQLNYNIAQMTELVRQESVAKADVLVVQGNENPEFVEALKIAAGQGTQIICMDTDISDFPEHLYIGTDNYDAGKQLGAAVVDAAEGLNRSVNVAVISGEEEYLNLQQRMQGFQEAISVSENLKINSISYDHFDGLTSLRLFHDLADENDIIVFLEGVPGTTLQTVYAGKLPEYEYIFGFDAFLGVKSGVLDGIILQDNNRIGELVLEKLGEEIRTGEQITGNFYTEALFLTKDNYDEVMK